METFDPSIRSLSIAHHCRAGAVMRLWDRWICRARSHRESGSRNHLCGPFVYSATRARRPRRRHLYIRKASASGRVSAQTSTYRLAPNRQSSARDARIARIVAWTACRTRGRRGEPLSHCFLTAISRPFHRAWRRRGVCSLPCNGSRRQPDRISARSPGPRLNCYPTARPSGTSTRAPRRLLAQNIRHERQPRNRPGRTSQGRGRKRRFV
jgi:hypothetical protein